MINKSKLLVGFLSCMLPVGSNPLGLKKYTYTRHERVKEKYKKPYIREITVQSVLGPPFSPILEVNEENKVVRTSEKKDYVVLENNGLIQPTVKFSLADRKSVGASSNKRQLSVLYKINCNYFKSTLNAWLTNGFNKPITGDKYLKIENQLQTFEGYVDNVPLKVQIQPSDFTNQSTPPVTGPEAGVLGSILDDGADKYLKVVVYKFIAAYNDKIQELNRSGVGTQSVGGLQLTPLGGLLNPFLTPVTGGNFNINRSNWLASRGLFCALPGTRVFRSPDDVNVGAGSSSEILNSEPDLAGRFMFPQMENESSEDLFSAVRKNVAYHFNAFSTLPVTFKLLQLDNFSTSLNEANEAVRVAEASGGGANNPLVRGFQSITRSIFGSNERNPDAQTAIQSLSTFLLDSPLFTIARQRTEQNNGRPLREITLTIISRKTNYTTNVGGQNEKPLSLSQSPFVFEYFEDEQKYERAYVSTDFLGAALDKALLNYVRQAQSMRIVYNSINFCMYAKKSWKAQTGKTVGAITKKAPLVSLGEKEAFFEALVGGTSTRDLVNMNTNLIFTAQFDQSVTSVYKTNRFITCSSFAEQGDLSTPEARKLWKSLEKGFGQTIVLSYYPYVALEPAFTRGKIIQTSNQVFFNGLVSNAGGDNQFPI